MQRSESALYAKSVFFHHLNDIDVFIEDTAVESRKIFVEILNRVFDGNFRVSQIFPIGPKPTVIKRCRADQGDRQRPAIYIVDGDYDFLLKESEDLKRFYRLSAYCIENYLIDFEAVVDIVNDDSVDLDADQIRSRLDFNGWVSVIKDLLLKIAISLVVTYKRQCDMKTVRIDLNQVNGDHKDHLDESKVSAFVDKYRNAVDERWGAGVFDNEYQEIFENISSDSYLRIPSGKGILMPLLRSRLLRKVDLNMNYPRLKVRLARRCDVTKLKGITLKVM